MKQLRILLIMGLSAMALLTGCVGLQIGGGDKRDVHSATLGQQLVDLQKAKDSGAINDAEYQAQKARLLNGK